MTEHIIDQTKIEFGDVVRIITDDQFNAIVNIRDSLIEWHHLN